VARGEKRNHVPNFGSSLRAHVRFACTIATYDAMLITLDPTEGKLATGKLELEVKADAPKQ
jgi:hypothetical protein